MEEYPLKLNRVCKITSNYYEYIDITIIVSKTVYEFFINNMPDEEYYALQGHDRVIMDFIVSNIQYSTGNIIDSSEVYSKLEARSKTKVTIR